MERRDNYLIQAGWAKQRFLRYDQEKIVRKFSLRADTEFVYVNLLRKPYRVNRTTGDFQKWHNDTWVDGNSYEEVMTLLDLLCDAADDRSLSGRWKNMHSFGLMFHQNLLEEQRNPAAERFDRDPQLLIRRCRELDGKPIPGADIGYAIELFDGLCIGLQFWHGDEEFLPRLRYLWDENALQYLRYETMYFAVTLLLRRLEE